MTSRCRFIPLVLVACASPSSPPVHHVGVMREVMREGRTEARAALADHLAPGTMALGALTGLQGEFLIDAGTPSSGPIGRPSRQRCSLVCAAASASSAATRQKALSRGFSRSMRSSTAQAVSTGLARRLRYSCSSWVALQSARSVGVFIAAISGAAAPRRRDRLR